MTGKISYSLHEYLSYLGKIHTFDLNENWGFYIDIERNKPLQIKHSTPILISTNNYVKKLSSIISENVLSNTNLKSIRSLKSVTNLNQSTDSLIFKLDDYKDLKNPYEKLNFVGNICLFSMIMIFVLFI
jgi:hypothetical protein